MTPDFHPPIRQVRSFGLWWLPGFLAGSAAWRVLQTGHAEPFVLACLAGAAGSVLLALVRPAAMRWLFVALTVLTYPIAWLVQFLVLATTYGLVLTPIALWLRLRGHDPLQLKPPAAGSSLWRKPVAKHDPERYFKP